MPEQIVVDTGTGYVIRYAPEGSVAFIERVGRVIAHEVKPHFIVYRPEGEVIGPELAALQLFFPIIVRRAPIAALEPTHPSECTVLPQSSTSERVVYCISCISARVSAFIASAGSTVRASSPSGSRSNRPWGSMSVE